MHVADAATYPMHAANGPDGKVYVVGHANPPRDKDENPFAWVLALRAEDGAILGERRLGGGDVTDYGRGVLPLPDGGFVVASSRYTDAAESSVHLWRFDALGNVLWEKDYRGETCTLIDRRGLALAENGDIFVAGKALKEPESTFWDGFLLRVDPEDGTVLWKATFGGEKNDFPYNVMATGDGGALVVGTTTSYPPHPTAAFLCKFDPEGNEEWARVFGGGVRHAVWGFDVAAFPDGSGYVFVGPAKPWGEGGPFAHTIVRVDDAGNLQWLAQLGGVRVDHTYGVAINDAGAIAVAGRGHSFHDDNMHHAFLALFAPDEDEGAPTEGEGAPSEEEGARAEEEGAHAEEEGAHAEEEGAHAEEEGARGAAEAYVSSTATKERAALKTPSKETLPRTGEWLTAGLLSLVGLTAVGAGAAVLVRRRSTSGETGLN